MMGKGSYFIGDFARVSTERSREFGKVSFVEKISGYHYKLADGFSYMAQELEPATRAEWEAYIEAHELATEQPATAPDGGGGLDARVVIPNDLDLFIEGWLLTEPYSLLSGRMITLKKRFGLDGYEIEANNEYITTVSESHYRSTVERVQRKRFEADNATLRAQLAAAEATAAGLRRERDAAVDALEPFEALWADWLDYCYGENQPYKDILEWLHKTHVVENVGKWMSTAAGVVRAQQAADAKPAGGA